jgi:dihydrofolate synthase/folylpolyglutamate synthase
MLELGKDIKVRRQGGGSFSYHGTSLNLKNLKTALPGLHQVKNAALAVAAVEALSGHGYRVKEEHIEAGLASVRWPGRLEVVRTSPTVILDGAHNPAAIAVLCDSLKRFYSWRHLIVIFGVLKDKKYSDMVKRLCTLADEVIITLPDTERAVSPEALLPLVAKYCRKTEVVSKPRDAVRKAMTAAASDDLICICGSLYLVGEVKGFLFEAPARR